MPKLENFATHLKIDGNPFAKNAINYQVQSGDTVGLYYTNDRDQRILKGTFARFDDWTNFQGTPYASFTALISDLDSFLFSSASAGMPLTAFGDLRNAELSPVFQGSFEYTVDNTELTTNTTQNGGTVTQAEGMAVVGTSTTTASFARLHAKRHARYRAGLGGLLRFTSLFTSPVDETIQYMGLAEAHGVVEQFTNGYTIGYSGTIFGFQRWQNDTLIEVAQADWNDPLDGTGASGMILDQTTLNVWEIRFQYLGAGAIELWVEDDSTGKFTRVHSIEYANQNTEPSVLNPNFIFMIHADNGATTSDIIVKCASYGYFIEGKTKYTETQQPLFSSGLQEKLTVTSEVAIFTIRNKATYAGKANRISIVLEAISSGIEANAANNLGKIRVVQNTVLGGVPAYSDINTTDSLVDIDIAGTTLTGGKEIFPFSLAGKNDEIFHGLTSHVIIIAPGETVTVSGESANSATIDASLLWRELF